MAQADLVARLESVASRLEKAASRIESGKGGGGGGDDIEAPLYVTEFQAIMNQHVAPAIKAAKELGIPDVPELLQKGYDNVFDLIKRIPSSKKPDQSVLMQFLKPGIDSINTADTLKVKGKDFKTWGDHYKAIYETLSGLSWVTMVPPGQLPFQHMEAQKQATEFNLNRILKDKKDEKSQQFVKKLQAMNKAVTDYVGTHFKKTGIEWNPKGSDFGSVKADSAASQPKAATKQETKEEKEQSKPAAASNTNALFGELNQGLDVTSGLKKVTSDMKSKNRPDKTGKVEIKETTKKTKREKPGPPSMKNAGGRWMVENYDEGQQVIDKVDMKTNVYITMSDDTVFQIPVKVKAINIDSCNNCRIFAKEVVSTVEIVNCKNVTLIVEDKAPSISVDKCQSPRIILLKKAYEAKPDIYTSNISAMNIEIPGKDNDDMVEIPIPEQYLTRIDCGTGRATTVETKHG
jgi:adenylyl cyclase-associated protein